MCQSTLQEYLTKSPAETFYKKPNYNFKLASRAYQKNNTEIKIREIVIGGKNVVIMAGPCAIESQDQLLKTAEIVSRSGLFVLRGGAYKPRTSPYDFQGLGKDGLELLSLAKKQFGLIIVTEVISPSDVELVSKYADILQIGSRNMQNYPLLKEVSKVQNPILLKRGMMATIEEFLMSAEYVLSGGNPNVILCERGIRTFERYTRNTLDITAIPVIKAISHLPIIVDPSHATGHRELVGPASKAAIAAGCDGLLIEIHPSPNEALSDGQQSLYPKEFKDLLDELKLLAKAVNREI